MTDADIELFKRSLNQLIGNGFLVSGIDKDRNLYSFVTAHTDIFEEYFLLAGWQLVVNESEGLITWNGPGSLRQNFTLDETFALLVFRILYEERRMEINLTLYPVINQLDFQERFQIVCERVLNKTRVREILKRFNMFKLIRVHGEETLPETVIELLPSLAYIVNSQTIEDAYTKVSSLKEKTLDEENDE